MTTIHSYDSMLQSELHREGQHWLLKPWAYGHLQQPTPLALGPHPFYTGQKSQQILICFKRNAEDRLGHFHTKPRQRLVDPHRFHTNALWSIFTLQVASTSIWELSWKIEINICSWLDIEGGSRLSLAFSWSRRRIDKILRLAVWNPITLCLNNKSSLSGFTQDVQLVCNDLHANRHKSQNKLPGKSNQHFVVGDELVCKAKGYVMLQTMVMCWSQDQWKIF